MSRRGAIVAGAMSVVAYAGLAAWSGHLSPLARGPLLDGLGPPVPYRWIDPPPDLASGNEAPSSGDFRIPLGAEGSEAQAFVTSDDQVTLVVPKDAFVVPPGQTEVRLRVDPIDPATLGSPGSELTIFGNAYRIRGSYRPSGNAATLSLPLDLVLLYPVTADFRSSFHQIYTSPDGESWTRQRGSDSLAQQQAAGSMPEFGFAMVAGQGAVPPVASGRSSTISRVLIVLSACVGLIGIGLLIRSRPRDS